MSLDLSTVRGFQIAFILLENMAKTSYRFVAGIINITTYTCNKIFHEL